MVAYAATTQSFTALPGLNSGAIVVTECRQNIFWQSFTLHVSVVKGYVFTLLRHETYFYHSIGLHNHSKMALSKERPDAADAVARCVSCLSARGLCEFGGAAASQPTCSSSLRSANGNLKCWPVRYSAARGRVCGPRCLYLFLSIYYYLCLFMFGMKVYLSRKRAYMVRIRGQLKEVFSF